MLFSLKEVANNPADFDLYFKKSYVHVIPPNGKPEWMLYEGWHPEGYVFSRGTRKRLVVNAKAFEQYQFDVYFPTGFFNSKDSVVFVERRGLRQNMKGLHGTNTICLTAIETIVQDLMSENTTLAVVLRVSPKLSVQFCNEVLESPEYPELDKAKRQIRSGRVFARALSNSLALVPHHQTGDYMIFMRWHPVAELLSRNRIRILVPDFRPELVDFFAPRGLEFIPQK